MVSHLLRAHTHKHKHVGPAGWVTWSPFNAWAEIAVMMSSDIQGCHGNWVSMNALHARLGIPDAKLTHISDYSRCYRCLERLVLCSLPPVQSVNFITCMKRKSCAWVWREKNPVSAVCLSCNLLW